ERDHDQRRATLKVITMGPSRTGGASFHVPPIQEFGMTARLYANLAQLREIVGDEFISQLTYPGIYRGSALNVSPVVIEIGGSRSVVISEADSDACKV